MFLSNSRFFQKKKGFKTKKFYFDKILIFSKLCILHLSRGIVRIEHTEKVAAIEKNFAVIGWKRIDKRATFACNL